MAKDSRTGAAEDALTSKTPNGEAMHSVVQPYATLVANILLVLSGPSGKRPRPRRQRPK